MASVNPYLELLKEEVLEHCSKIDTSIGSSNALKMQDFQKMSSVINRSLAQTTLHPKRTMEQVGVTVSVSTLRRIYKYGYSPDTKDARVTASLNRLCIFSGYLSWEAFTAQKSKDFGIGAISLEETLRQTILSANNAEFTAYKHLPEVFTQELDQYFIQEGTAYMRIKNILIEHSKKQWTLQNENNPSGFTIHSIKIERVTSKEVTIKTEEYWYLRWFEIRTEMYRHIYNEDNVQRWTLVFTNGVWKVLSTYYPPPKNSIHITHIIFASFSTILGLKKHFEKH